MTFLKTILVFLRNRGLPMMMACDLVMFSILTFGMVVLHILMSSYAVLFSLPVFLALLLVLG